MSTFEVKVCRVAIEEHPNADSLDLAVVGDYRSCVRKGQFASGDLVAYIPEDSIVTPWLQKELGVEGKLAGPKHNRVKAVRLRGTLSQGLVMKARDYWVEGQDVAEELHIKKYEVPVPPALAGEVYNAGGRRTIKYDIENWKKFNKEIPEGLNVVMTEKIHGCLHGSSRILLPDGSTKSISTLVDEPGEVDVVSYDIENKKFIVRKVTGKMRRPNLEKRRWIRLTFGNEMLVLTTDHPVYSRTRNGWFPAIAIALGEDVESPFR